MRSPFILTGASGWFGRVALLEYERLHGPEALRRDVVACSSNIKRVNFGSPHGTIETIPLEDLLNKPKFSGILHLAFLTRDRIQSLGQLEYIQKNRRISAIVASLLDANPGIPAITTSSGAAAEIESQGIRVEEDPYGVLKLEEEKLWADSAKDRLAVVFRVYAASGRFMKNPTIFALGDFITSALEGKQITVKSNRQVIRSYVNVGCLMGLCWAILKDPVGKGYHQVNASSHSISLIDLASMISRIWGLPEPISAIDQGLPANAYVADEAPFLRLLENYNLSTPDLASQIRETGADIEESMRRKF